MTDEQIAAFIYAKTVMATATIQGMIAENQSRAMNCERVAYHESSFLQVRDELEEVLRLFNFVESVKSTHMHVGPDRICATCGMDLTNSVHKRV